jgi:ribonuclease R
MASVAFAERILRFIQAKGYQPQQVEELAQAMGIGAEEQGDFHDACRALMRSGRIVLGSGNALTLPAPPGRLTGSFRANRRGFGFVIPDTPNSHGDIYVPPEATSGAMTGDRVMISVKKRGKRGGAMLYEGRVVKILERGQSRFVGQLFNQFNRWFVVPEGQTLHGPIVVADPGAKNARPGDQVVVEITEYPTENREARGAIVRVLGQHGLPDVDTMSVIEQFQLPHDFPEAVLDEAREVVAEYHPAAEALHREDLQDLTIITIDPTDARDFDDAISLTRTLPPLPSRRSAVAEADHRGVEGGAWELGVHIADVAHFVRDGGAIDAEAKERANSIYLPRHVIPMIPEALSNGVCSLQEREPRLTKSVFITYDSRGRVKKTRFANSIIRSTKRLTYEQATAILEGKGPRISAKVSELLTDMEALARIIQARRVREGMLSMEFPDAEIVFDDEGRAADVVLEDTSYSHTIIEMFMVEANEALARLMVEHGVPCLRRIHGEPTDLADGTLQRFVRALGLDLPEKPDRFDLQKLLDRAKGTPASFAVNLAVLRSMQQAEYSPALIGHYALASEHYAHFTSPIRRYPDLTVHRLLDAYLARSPNRAATVRSRTRRGEERSPSRRAASSNKNESDGKFTDSPTFEDLVELGTHCSANERRAEAAEKELKQVLILRLLEGKLGEKFGGTVTGVANVGLFIQLDKYLIDGLLRFDALPEDWWEVDAEHGCVIGERSGRRIAIGDRLAVAIARIHIPTRTLDLGLAEPLPGPSRDREGARSPSSRRSGGNQHRPSRANQNRDREGAARLRRPSAARSSAKPRRKRPRDHARSQRRKGRR